MTRRQIDGTTRESLAMDAEFNKFLFERRADEQRDVDRLDSEIDTLQCQIDSKRREQTEHLNIIEVCNGGLAKQNRPAPQLTPKPEESVIDGPLHGEGE